MLNLENVKPIDLLAHSDFASKLQGNILKGHGRDFAVNIFLTFTTSDLPKEEQMPARRRLLRDLAAKYVTSMERQRAEADQFRRFRLPGSLFGNLMLTRVGYEQLGFDDATLKAWFIDHLKGSGSREPVATFLLGMRRSWNALGDPDPNATSDAGDLDPLEQAYRNRAIHALLLLADDSEHYLLRTARELVTSLEQAGVVTVAAVEVGRALRMGEEQEGYDHFGFVDGRSQPRFLASDFEDLVNGAVVGGTTRERVAMNAPRRESGSVKHWNPFAHLGLALRKDPAVPDPEAFGSYFVFRKLEQDVLRFAIAEQRLADALGLQGADRARAGAMIVGRFRDGSPLAVSESDGMVPAKYNDFHYEPMSGAEFGADGDANGYRCPFHAHIRKVNPRGKGYERGRRIVRRSIPYGNAGTGPARYGDLSGLPSRGVGLLFGCFQGSIVNQFALMQSTWANSPSFGDPRLPNDPNLSGGTGSDPLIGQPPENNPQHRWRRQYDGAPPNAYESFDFGKFVTFRGGEFFFAPSLPFFAAL